MNEARPWPDLRALRALGFGLDAALMNDPKLFVDRRFLATLLDQLDRELGRDESASTLFQVGLLHGLRDAQRILRHGFATSGSNGIEAQAASPLPMQLKRENPSDSAAGIEFSGVWPEAYESDARLAHVGPDREPCCSLSAGYTSGWLSGTLDADILALERECVVQGGDQCRFVAREAAAWRTSGDLRANAILDLLCFTRLREAAADAECALQPVSEGFGRARHEGDFDREAHVVHVWGPVMVLPFMGPDEALDTIEMLSRDASTAEIRCVVVDLRDTPLDEGFGAAALEQILDVVESWGAEAILTGVSIVNESAVHDLEDQRLLLRKDLPAAIATAFQIAEAQRDLL